MSSGPQPPISEEASQRLQDAFRFGGAEAAVRDEQRALVPYFRGCRAVLDIGCGRGIMLDLLREASIGAEGVDHMPEAVDYCIGKGHRAVVADGVDYLEGKVEQYDGIFCSHVMEHLEFGRAERLLALCSRALRPGGLLVIVTPNARDINVMGEVFWLDPTHLRPYPAMLIDAMLKREGLVTLETRTPTVRPARFMEWPGWIVRKLALGRYFGSLNLIVVARRP